MSRFGTVRNIDNLGRLVIPVELRRVLDIGPEGAPVEILAADDGETLVLRRYRESCVFCGQNTTREVLGRRVCSTCRAELAGVVSDGGE